MSSTPLRTSPASPLEQPPQPFFTADADNAAALIASSRPSESSSSCSSAPRLDLSIPFPSTNKPTNQVENSKKTLPKPSGPVPGPSTSSEEGEIRATEDSGMSAPAKPITNGKNNEKQKAVPFSKSEPVSPEAMRRLLDQVPDLKEWLDLTEFHNVESRKRKLDRYRRAKRLAVEKRRIEEEEQKLFEEEERDSNIRRRKREYDDAWDEQRRERASRDSNSSYRGHNGSTPRSPRDRMHDFSGRRGGGYYSPRHEY